jgi:hypothetical protein
VVMRGSLFVFLVAHVIMVQDDDSFGEYIVEKCLFYWYVPYNPSFDINADMPFAQILMHVLLV